MSLLVVYLLPLLLIWAWYLVRRSRQESASRAARDQAQAAGLIDPASLHPVIDPVRCIGCGSCVKACPEQPEHRVLGLIDGKAHLVGPTDCIGARRLPRCLPGGRDHARIRHRTSWRRDSVAHCGVRVDRPWVVRRGRARGHGAHPQRTGAGQAGGRCDPAQAAQPQSPGSSIQPIVGAGPAGFSASLAAKSHDMQFVTIEQESLAAASSIPAAEAGHDAAGRDSNWSARFAFARPPKRSCWPSGRTSSARPA